MKEICIDVRMAFYSGIGTYIRNIIPFLKDAFNLRLLAFDSLIEKWPELGKYDLIPVNAPIYSIQEQLELPFKIPSCDLFWTPHYNTPLSPIRAKKRLTTIHDVNHLALGSSLGWLKRGYAKMMIPAAAARADHLITISDFSKSELIKWAKADEKKVSVIHLGVDQNKFARDGGKASGLNYFLFVSTLMPHKNLARLVKAWNRVSQKFPDWQLMVAGKKTEHVSDLKLASNVHLLGQVGDEELVRLYLGASAFIAPSIYEGFGLPPLEAMAAGCPTIVSNAASFPEVCGDASLYCDPFDEEDMAQKICTLIENPSLRQTLIDAGRKRVDLFSWEKAANAHMEVIDRL
ncbi:MAG: glycosyltransferase family 1 protein [Rhabdochlamydiaceae bacterium]|jgi:glycosyltransferase involved in cell wall biosynthesis